MGSSSMAWVSAKYIINACQINEYGLIIIMASLLHSKVVFTTPEPTVGQYDALVQKAEFVTHNAIPALITTDLLHTGNVAFADLISSHINSPNAELLVLAEDNAVEANTQLPSHIDSYFAAYPALTIFDTLVVSKNSVKTLAATVSADQIVLAFGGQQFIAAVNKALSQSNVPFIAIATRAHGQTMTQYDALAQLLQNEDQTQLLCACLDSRLIISDLQYDRSTWVVRGIQHSLFHDSQLFHWIEGNFHRLLGEERTAIDHLFIKVVSKLTAPADQTLAETQLHKLFFSLWRNDDSNPSLSLIGYAQAMTTTLLLSVQYAIQVEALEEGVDARLLGLLKQIVWIAPGSTRRLQPSQALQEIPVLNALGKHTMQPLDKAAMQRAEVWVSKEAENRTHAA